MRRGILNRRSLIIIFLVATSTVLSFLFDQLVIRTEDSIRNLNIDFKNIENHRIKNEIISDSLYNLASDFSTTIYPYYLNRNFHIKSIISTEVKKDLSFFENKTENIRDIKIDLISQFEDVTDHLDKIYVYYSTFYLFNKELIEETSKNEIDDLENLFSFHFPNKDKENKFFLKGKDKYLKLVNLSKTKLENERYYEYIEDKLEKFNTSDWVNVNNYKMLTLELINNDLTKLDKMADLFEKKIIELIEKEDAKFEEIKFLNIRKNYFILISITFQIISLLFLLLLFRSFLIKVN